MEGSSSNYLELAAFVLALCGTYVTNPMLYVYDNQALLTALKKIGRWRRKNNVSRSARRRYFTGSIQRAPKRINSRSSDVSGQSGSASKRTCMVKSQHPSRQGLFKQRCSHGMRDRTNRAFFTWQEPLLRWDTVNYEDQKSTKNSRVRKSIRRGSAEEEVRKHSDRVTRACKSANNDDESMSAMIRIW